MAFEQLAEPHTQHASGTRRPPVAVRTDTAWHGIVASYVGSEAKNRSLPQLSQDGAVYIRRGTETGSKRGFHRGHAHTYAHTRSMGKPTGLPCPAMIFAESTYVNVHRDDVEDVTKISGLPFPVWTGWTAGRLAGWLEGGGESKTRRGGGGGGAEARRRVNAQAHAWGLHRTTGHRCSVDGRAHYRQKHRHRKSTVDMAIIKHGSNRGQPGYEPSKDLPFDEP